VGPQRRRHGAAAASALMLLELPLGVGADAGHDRDVVLANVAQDAGVDLLDPAHEAMSWPLGRRLPDAGNTPARRRPTGPRGAGRGG